jgi:hypothetical protein
VRYPIVRSKFEVIFCVPGPYTPQMAKTSDHERSGSNPISDAALARAPFHAAIRNLR